MPVDRILIYRQNDVLPTEGVKLANWLAAVMVASPDLTSRSVQDDPFMEPCSFQLRSKLEEEL